jgi:hypothetical protein
MPRRITLCRPAAANEVVVAMEGRPCGIGPSSDNAANIQDRFMASAMPDRGRPELGPRHADTLLASTGSPSLTLRPHQQLQQLGDIDGDAPCNPI